MLIKTLSRTQLSAFFVTSLVLLATLFTVGLLHFNRLNNDLKSLNVFADQMLKMNLVAEELNSNVFLIDSEKIPEIRYATAISSLATSKKIDDLIVFAQYSLQKMSVEMRTSILKSTAFGENYLWPYQRMSDLSNDMNIVRDLTRRGLPIRYKNKAGMEINIKDPEPLVLMAHKIASPYVNFIKDAAKEQRSFVYHQSVLQLEAISNFLYKSALGGIFLFAMMILFFFLPSIKDLKTLLKKIDKLIPAD